MIDEHLGGAGIDSRHPHPDETSGSRREADAILLAAIGSPQYDGAAVRPEQGLLALQGISMPLFNQLRFLRVSPFVTSQTRTNCWCRLCRGAELTGGIYFGDHILEERKARDINDYSYEEVSTICVPKLQGRKKLLPALISKCWQHQTLASSW